MKEKELQKIAQNSLKTSNDVAVFTSDNWDPFEEGLLNVYGFLETPSYCGIGRKPDPILIPYPNLKYAKVCKKIKIAI